MLRLYIFSDRYVFNNIPPMPWHHHCIPIDNWTTQSRRLCPCLQAQDAACFDLAAAESQATHRLLEAYQRGTEGLPPECAPLEAAFAVVAGCLGLRQPQWGETQRHQHWHR